VHKSVRHPADGLHFLRDAAQLVARVRGAEDGRAADIRGVTAQFTESGVASGIGYSTNCRSSDQPILRAARDRFVPGTREQTVVIVPEGDGVGPVHTLGADAEIIIVDPA